MAKTEMYTFEAKLLRPAKPGKDESWAFLVLPKTASDKLPRRGRTTAVGTINDFPFHLTLDPDGQLSHWLKVSKELAEAASVNIGDMVKIRISPSDLELEPTLPDDLQEALAGAPAATAVWDATTLATCNPKRLDLHSTPFSTRINCVQPLPQTRISCY